MEQLSECEKRLYDLAKNENKDIALFRTVVGKRYFGGEMRMMLVGRAGNGLPNDDEELFALDKRQTFKWMEDYLLGLGNGLNKSAFWRVTGRIFEGLCGETNEKDWYESIVWTNLYRLSPRESGNPSNTLCRKQEPFCISALRDDITKYKPTHILFITGDWVEGFGLPFDNSGVCDGVIIQRAGLINGAKALVTRRPEMRPEDTYVQKVLQAYAKMK